jgi:TM2 domain-containing membrane protein YozV
VNGIHKIVNGVHKIVNGIHKIVNGKIVNGTARPPELVQMIV